MIYFCSFTIWCILGHVIRGGGGGGGGGGQYFNKNNIFRWIAETFIKEHLDGRPQQCPVTCSVHYRQKGNSAYEEIVTKVSDDHLYHQMHWISSRQSKMFLSTGCVRMMGYSTLYHSKNLTSEWVLQIIHPLTRTYCTPNVSTILYYTYIYFCRYHYAIINYPGAHLITWFNFNPSRDK